MGDESRTLSEDYLRAVSKQIKTVVPRSDAGNLTENDIKPFTILFEDVLYTARRPSLSATHRVAAWNVLCGLIDQCVASDSELITSLLWNGRLWDRSFDLYLTQSHTARPKSSKQLLTTLCASLNSYEDSQDFRLHVCRRLLAGVKNWHDFGHAKACLQVLATFLRKDVLPLDLVLSALSEYIPERIDESRNAVVSSLLCLLFECAITQDLGSVTGQAISAVLDRTEQRTLTEPAWLDPLQQVLCGNDVDLDEVRNQLMPILFQRSLSHYWLFLNRNGLQDLINQTQTESLQRGSSHGDISQILLGALVVGKELGLLYETENSNMSVNDNYLLMPVRCIERLLYHSISLARLSGLALFVTSRSATRPFPPATFRILKRRLSLFFADTDANFRSEVVSYMQRLIDRLRAITAVLARQSRTDSVSATALLEHEKFLWWLLRFLHWELRPTASYQRHISALKTLLVVVKSGLDSSIAVTLLSKSASNETKWPFSIRIITNELQRQLLDLLMDPFDDVRQCAASILSLCAASMSSVESKDFQDVLSGATKQAETVMLKTGRADHADGVARLYQILFNFNDRSIEGSRNSGNSRPPVVAHLVDSLESMISTAKNSLATATCGYPMHGLLTSIQYTISQHEEAYRSEDIPIRLIDCLRQIWDIVKPVLCNDAPEGFIPDDSADLQDVNTKDTLSYCWRALKESSLLLGMLANSKLLETSQLLAMGDLCFTQLSELRHRGAFSTVAQTWITCCIRCRSLEIAQQNALTRWYDSVLNSLKNQTTINTRRSAGLPSLVCGLLIADQSGQFTSRAIDDLTAIACEPIDLEDAHEGSLPQVHALNCVKDILKNTRLSERSERYVAHVFLLAADSLRSHAWAVRNCGLMLFRAAIDRLLGTSESHLDEKSAALNHISLADQPQLLDVIFALLRPPVETASGDASRNESVFPALQLLQRVQIPEARKAEAEKAVLRLTFNRSWHVRDKAARTYARIVSQDRILTELEQILLCEPTNSNDKHGALLCVKHTVAMLTSHEPRGANALHSTDPSSYIDDATDSAIDQLSVICNTITEIYYQCSCPLIKSAAVEALLTCHDSMRVNPQGSRDLDTIDLSKQLAVSMTNSFTGPGEFHLRKALACATAHQSLERNIDFHAFVSSVLQLAPIDTDACTAMLEALRTEVLPFSALPEASILALLSAASNILSDDFNIRLKCEAQRLLLYLADSRTIIQATNVSAAFLDGCDSATAPTEKRSNQVYADQWLQLEALSCELLIAADQACVSESTSKLARFVSCCKLAVQQEHFSLFGREAVALALNRLETLWHHLEPAQSHRFLDICLIVYDLLNDDDEDIRQLAAKIVRRFLQAQRATYATQPCEPTTASQYLVKYMLSKWQDDRIFAEEAIYRAFGITSVGDITAVADRLVTSSDVDTALFIQEKQNLYIDEAREVRLWSQVIGAMHPIAFSRKLLARLAQWVSDGLDDLIATTGSKHDGPLGWSTKPDIFVAGLQVIDSTEILLKLVANGVRIVVAPSVLRVKLMRLAQVAEVGNVNQLWTQEVERVLVWAARSQLTLQHRLLTFVSSVARSESALQ